MSDAPDTERATAGVSAVTLRRAGRRVGSVLLFAVLPLALAMTMLALAIGDSYAFDFRQFWRGGRDVLEGVSPYPTETSLALARAQASLSPQQIQELLKFPYPAPAALMMVPFALLPFGAAAAVMTALSVAAMALTLRILGVRDWRCYGVALLAIPVLEGFLLGTLTPVLALALAVVWRWRDRPWIAALALATIVVTKLFLWPVAFWLLATKRAGAAVLAAAAALGSTVAAWAVLGFAGLDAYAELLRTLARAVQDEGYSTVALVLALGGPEEVARGAALAAGAVLLTAVVALGRRGDDAASFAAAVTAALVMTPIVWMHYFALLLVPIAIIRPRLAPLWFVPPALWLTPFPESGGEVWRIGLTHCVVLAVLAAVIVSHRAHGAGDAREAPTTP